MVRAMAAAPLGYNTEISSGIDRCSEEAVFCAAPERALMVAASPPILPRTTTEFVSLSLRGTVHEMPAISFQAILDKALADYHDQIGVELDKHPFADELRGRDSPDDVLKLLEDKANAFRVYRDGNCKLIVWLSPVVQIIHTLSGVPGEAVPIQPAKAIFVGVDVLITVRPLTCFTDNIS
ncbi:hypothetical protein EDB86DRAFT_950033 [Lactarius hatsudake]|nr:hypothetical protein EDB86DRAFT_950033 [Lactarius hatsudake]